MSFFTFFFLRIVRWIYRVKRLYMIVVSVLSFGFRCTVYNIVYLNELVIFKYIRCDNLNEIDRKRLG